jgi:hypothetical protein
LYEAISCVALPSASWARRGGAGDGGVDLVGRLSGGASQLSLVAQCKWQRERVGAPVVTALAAVVSQRGSAAAGVLFASSGFSRDAARAALSSRAPLLLAHLSLAVGDGGSVGGGGGGAREPPEDGTSADVTAMLEALSPNRAFLVAFPGAEDALARGDAPACDARAATLSPPPPLPPPPPRLYRIVFEGRELRVLLARRSGAGG